MPTLTQGQIGSENIEKGHRLTVTVSTAGAAIVERFHNGVLLETTPLSGGTSLVYGEYLVDIELRISCVNGAVTYAESQRTDAVNVGANPANGQLMVDGAAVGAKVKSKPSGRAVAFGDSITHGDALQTQANAYAHLIAGERGWSITNLSIGGTIVSQWMDGQLGSLSVNAGDQFFTMAGFNDARYAGTDPSKLTQFQTALYACLAYCSVPDSCKVFSQVNADENYNPAMTFSGSWSASPTWRAQQTASKMGAYSSASGAYCETTVTGDTVDIMLGGQSTVASSFFVTIDGVRLGAVGTSTPAPIVAPANGGGEIWQPYCLRITGLANKSHIVRVTVASSAVLLVGYIAGWDSTSRSLPSVYVGGTIRMLTSSYAIAPANATDSVMREYRNAVKSVCETLADEGSFVRYVDLDRAFAPTTGSISSTDFVHPLEMSHVQFKQAFTREINRPTLR